eukprot:19774-Heterococcus_DN1.PRE.1
MHAVDTRWQDELQQPKSAKSSSTLQDLLQSARSLRQSVLPAPAVLEEEALGDEGMWHAVFNRQRRSRARVESTRMQQQQQQHLDDKQKSSCADFELDAPAPSARYAPFHSGIGKRTCSDASLSPVRHADRMMTRENSMMTSFSEASSQWGDCSQATSAAAALSAGALLRSDSVLQAQFGMLRQQLRERGLADLADAGTRRCSQSTYDDGQHRSADVDGLDSFR